MPLLIELGSVWLVRNYKYFAPAGAPSFCVICGPLFFAPYAPLREPSYCSLLTAEYTHAAT